MLILLQASRTATPLPPPAYQDPISLYAVAGIAALNPVAVVVAFLMGRHADSPMKLIISAFAGAAAGIATLWLEARLGLGFATGSSRAASGIFVVSFVLCLFWAWLGRRLSPVDAPPSAE